MNKRGFIEKNNVFQLKETFFGLNSMKETGFIEKTMFFNEKTQF